MSRPPEASEALVPALKAWRLAEARRQGVPAFRILTDRTLVALARARPANEADLLGSRRVGEAWLDGREVKLFLAPTLLCYTAGGEGGLSAGRSPPPSRSAAPVVYG